MITVSVRPLTLVNSMIMDIKHSLYPCFDYFPVLVCAALAREPMYVWPLGNTTVNREVIRGKHLRLQDARDCFRFGPPLPGLPYDAIKTGESSTFFDAKMNSRVDFDDLSFSFYVHPDGVAAGTVFQYMHETGEIIRMRVVFGIAFISFRSEHGISLGNIDIEGFLAEDKWNHVVISREYETGRITIFRNQEKVIDQDDEYPNKISLPKGGTLRIGASLDEDEADPFPGEITCFSMYGHVLEPTDVSQTDQDCLPENWRVIPRGKCPAR